MTKAQINKKIGERIIELRTKKGWKQIELAKACNKDRQAIEKIENGKVNATIYSLYIIAQGLEVPLSEIIKIEK